ncbi:MAG: carbohydrate kinase family protein [Bacillota bacterium]
MILVIGDINLDIIVNLREEINFDTDSDSEINFKGGGSAANFSFWLDYLNTPVRFISKTGDDFISKFLKKEIKDTDIEYINLKSQKESGRIVVLLDKQGARTMITDRKANLDFKENDIKDKFFNGISHLHIGAYSFFGGKNMINTALKTINEAKKRKISISFDPSSYSMIKEYGVKKILKQTKNIDFCFPNLEEAKVLTNRSKPENMVKELLYNYKNVVLKYGKKGCFIGNSNDIEFIEQNKKIENGDTTGAGDAFTAAFVSSYLKNNTLKKAAVYANQVSAECVKKTGGRPY